MDWRARAALVQPGRQADAGVKDERDAAVKQRLNDGRHVLTPEIHVQDGPIHSLDIEQAQGTRDRGRRADREAAGLHDGPFQIEGDDEFVLDDEDRALPN